MKLKSFIFYFLILAITLNVIIIYPKTAGAVVGVADTAVVTDPIHTALTAGGWVAEAARWAKDIIKEIALTIKKSAFELFKKRVLDKMVDDLAQWITYGDEKKPKWAEGDFNELAQNAAQAAIGDLVLKTSLAQICSPFKAKLLLTLTPPGPVSDQIKCTLDQITGNVNAFLADFKNGGWIAYNELWQPRNNYYATVLMTLDAVDREGGRAASAKQNEVIAGQGFLATERCDYYPDPDGVYRDKFGHKVTGADTEAIQNGEWVNTYSRKCYKTTPGSTIAGLALKTNTIQIDRLIGAQNIEAYIATLADALINRVIKDGLSSLKGLTTQNPNQPQPRPGNPCDGLTGTALESCLGYDTISKNIWNSDRATLASQYDDTLEPRQKASGLLAQVIDKQNKLVSALENLSTCQQSTGYSQEAKDTQQELTVEKDKLVSLQTQLEDNDTIIDNLEQSKTNIENTPQEDGNSLILQTDYLQSVGDPLTAKQVLDDAQAEFDGLVDTDTKITSVQSQNTCQPTAPVL